MGFFEKVKNWFVKNKEIILKGGGILLLAGTGIAYVISNKGKISFDEWLETASTDELEDAHERLRTEEFLKTGTKPHEMERISEELGARGAKAWFEEHPQNTDPSYRWTDANRWDQD